MNEDLNDIEINVLNLIINSNKYKPITSKELIAWTGLSFRKLKVIITKLRQYYAIVSKETDGGGYWIAENTDDINNFINMIGRRMNGYQETINTMQKYLRR